MAGSYLSRKGYEKLVTDLAKLKERKRKLSTEIGEAAEKGDLRENAEYTYAKERQAEILRRIDEVEQKIRTGQNGGSRCAPAMRSRPGGTCSSAHTIPGQVRDISRQPLSKLSLSGRSSRTPLISVLWRISRPTTFKIMGNPSPLMALSMSSSELTSWRPGVSAPQRCRNNLLSISSRGWSNQSAQPAGRCRLTAGFATGGTG